MVLEIHPMTPSDIPSFIAINIAAFQNGITSMLFPNPKTPDQVQADIDRHVNTMKNEPDARYVKVIDTDLENEDGTKGKMIAGAKWRVNLEERSEEVVLAQRRTIPDGEEASVALRDFSEWLEDMRWKWMGTKPFFCEC